MKSSGKASRATRRLLRVRRSPSEKGASMSSKETSVPPGNGKELGGGRKVKVDSPKEPLLWGEKETTTTRGRPLVMGEARDLSPKGGVPF